MLLELGGKNPIIVIRGADGVVGVVAVDGTRPAWRPDSFDRVLVDAPCTGLGALRRRPEARGRNLTAPLAPPA